jgi:Reverse transcriptase (RNA-dependent DNA polymerase)
MSPALGTTLDTNHSTSNHRPHSPSHLVTQSQTEHSPTFSSYDNLTPLNPILRRSHRGYTPSFRHLDALQHQVATAINVDTGALCEYQQLLKSSEGHLWEASACEEWARLAQGLPSAGIPASQGTNTIRFIPITDIPQGRKATYPRIVVADRPQKAQSRRVRVTVGGDQISYPHDVSTKTSGLATVKILLNSTISTTGARFMCIDIKDFYLNTPMSRSEYMRVPLGSIPKAILDTYNLHSISHNGNVYVEISKGMYGLPQAGKLANDALILHLRAQGYHQCPQTPGLFTHQSRPISFCLVVDDFGVKYVGKEHAQHLINTLNQHYTITEDWTGDTYLGMHLNWQYTAGHVDISMPGYVQKALQRFEHHPPTKPQFAPHEAPIPQYGAKSQQTAELDTSPLLAPDRVRRLQQIVGTFLYYARAIDSTMLVALGSLAAAQSCATVNTEKHITQFLDYAATNPTAAVRFTASDMILTIQSDASYHSEPQARSRAGGIFYLSSTLDPSDVNHPKLPPINGAIHISDPLPLGTPAPVIDPVTNQITTSPINGAIHITSVIMKNVLSSVAEAEIAACYYNAQEACALRTALLTLGHPQPPTPIQTDNSTADGILNSTVKQKRSKAIDMRFYWLRDRIEQKQFQVHWQPGSLNFADYFTKHHPPKHHQNIRPAYLVAVSDTGIS